MEIHSARLLANVPLAGNVQRLTLRVEGVPPRFLPGQYIALRAPDGARVYFSIASSPSELPRIELHYAPTPGSPDVPRMDALLAGTHIDFEAPAGNTGLFARPDARDVVLAVAATGVAQGMSIVRGWIEDRGRQQPHAGAQRLCLYWGVRTPDQLYAADLLNTWADREPAFAWHAVVSDDDTWPGRRGLLVDALLADAVPSAADLVILAGSPTMVQATAERLLQAGLPREHLCSDML